MNLSPAVPALLLAAACLGVLLLPAGIDLGRLTVAFIVSDVLVQVLKRAIFQFGPQEQSVYYGVQIIPTVILSVALVVVVANRSGTHTRQKRLSSGQWLLGYLSLAGLLTLVSPRGAGWTVRAAAIEQQLLPFCLFFVGSSLAFRHSRKIGRTLSWLALISVVYGVYQFFHGPTALERTWADYTGSYSIMAHNVRNYLDGVTSDFRAFSFYGDGNTWGLFLVDALVGSILGYLIRSRKHGWLGVAMGVTAGLLVCMTRTPWVMLLVTAAVFAGLRFAAVRRPWVIAAVCAAGFPAVIVGGGFVFQRLFVEQRIGRLEGTMEGRYGTIGTLEARLRGWEYLTALPRQRLVLGTGYGNNEYFSRMGQEVEVESASNSHNFVVEMVLETGVPGVLLFLAFYLAWLREALLALKQTNRPGIRLAIRLVIAYSVGAIYSGYFSGASFMNAYYFLFLGMVAGHARMQPAPVRLRWIEIERRIGPGVLLTKERCQ